MNLKYKSLSPKLIIVLITLLLFNVLYPSMVHAVDLGGILLQPLYWLLLGIIIPADLTLGATIWLKEFDWGDIGDYSSSILDGDYGTNLADWFVGPDTIFLR